MPNRLAARRLAAVAMAGAALQLVYGVLAVLWPYPQIIAPAPELLWGFINLGMMAGIAAWLANDVARPRWLALIGGGMAILGHLTTAQVDRVAAALDDIKSAVVAEFGPDYLAGHDHTQHRAPKEGAIN